VLDVIRKREEGAGKRDRQREEEQLARARDEHGGDFDRKRQLAPGLDPLLAARGDEALHQRQDGERDEERQRREGPVAQAGPPAFRPPDLRPANHGEGLVVTVQIIEPTPAGRTRLSKPGTILRRVVKWSRLFYDLSSNGPKARTVATAAPRTRLY